MVKPQMLFPDEHRRHDERKIWVVGNECLWKYSQLDSLGSGAADRVANALDGAGAACEVRRNLDRCCFDPLHGWVGEQQAYRYWLVMTRSLCILLRNTCKTFAHIIAQTATIWLKIFS
jgi:hypothetical protein